MQHPLRALPVLRRLEVQQVQEHQVDAEGPLRDGSDRHPRGEVVVDLRGYQKRGYASVLADLNTVDSTLIVMATGTGKTVLFAHLAKQFAERGRVLVLAHRGELVYQARDK